MKLIIFTLLFSTKIFASIAPIENIKCYYYNDPNRYPVLMLYFTEGTEHLELTINQKENDFDDEAIVTTLFQEKIEASEVENTLVVTGKNLNLKISEGIAVLSFQEKLTSLACYNE